jgi:flagellin
VINGVNITGTSATESATIGLINGQTALTGVVAADNGGKISLSAADGRNITVATANGGTALSGFVAGPATVEGTVTLKTVNTTAASAAIAVSGTVGSSGFSATTTTASLNSGTVSSANVLTIASSNSALSTIDAALQAVAATGAQLGAYQNRFQAAITGLNTDSTNLSAARSSIQDTNYAQATSDLSKAQILQQASTAMVAQANTVPQNVLTLLQKLP